MDDRTPTNWREAMNRALEWAEGSRSNSARFLAVEDDPADRVNTLAMVSVADASEVRKWAAIAEGFSSREREARRT